MRLRRELRRRRLRERLVARGAPKRKGRGKDRQQRRSKGTGGLRREKTGMYTVRCIINGRRIAKSTGTKNREEAERFLKRFLAPYVKSDAERTLADAVSAAAAPSAGPAPAGSAVRRFCGCRKRAGLSLLPRHRPRHRRYCSSCMPSSEPRGIATVREARRDSALA